VLIPTAHAYSNLSTVYEQYAGNDGLINGTFRWRSFTEPSGSAVLGVVFNEFVLVYSVLYSSSKIPMHKLLPRMCRA
jgi:hypothetical protein